jgi:hypothetical protein
MEWHTEDVFAGLLSTEARDKDKFKAFDFAPQDRIKINSARDKDRNPYPISLGRVPPSPFHGKGGTLPKEKHRIRNMSRAGKR